MKKQNVRTLSFIVSTFTYLLIGAAIFDALESQTEEATRDNLEKSEIDYKHKYNISNDEYKSLEDIVIKYHPYRTFPQWKFTGAFYFSLTVITTIGYGHSTPQTIFGKIFCMFYAIVGIPLCLVMFQSVGERLNYFASFCIQLVKKCIRVRNTEVNQTEMVCVAGVFAIFVITGGAAMFSHYEGWTYFNSIYYCVITLTTIGFGDFVALQDKNNLSNTSYVILSFTFILFGLTVVASSINLLVLKFLTMNTDDERREEFSRKAQENNNSLRFSSADLLNVVNGTVLCTFEPNDLEDLRRENSLKFCFPTSKRSLNNFIHGKFPYLSWKKSFELENLNDDNNNENYLYTTEPHAKLNITNSSSLSDFTKTSSLKKNTCPSCLNTKSRKKSHYTIRRGPGKISHLLITNQRVNSLDANADNQDELNLKVNNRDLNSSSSFSSFNNIVITHNNTEITSNNNNNIKRLSSTCSAMNKKTSEEISDALKPNINFDINLYIDDDNETENDCTNNETNFYENNKLNNNTNSNYISNVGPNKKSIDNSNNKNFLSINSIELNKLRKSSSNDISSQNMTDETNTDGEYFIKTPNSTNDNITNLDNNNSSSQNKIDEYYPNVLTKRNLYDKRGKKLRNEHGGVGGGDDDDDDEQSSLYGIDNCDEFNSKKLFDDLKYDYV